MAAGGMDPLREKSIRLTGYLEWLLRREIADAVEIFTPEDPRQRGCQLSLRVKPGASAAKAGVQHGKDVFRRIEAAGVTCDWREPDVIRVAPVPLYNRYEEVCRFVEILRGRSDEVRDGKPLRTPRDTEEITLVGAGLAGSLLAIDLARRGHRVTIHERRPDPRRGVGSAGRSINLALANRGIHALEQAGLMDRLRPALIPMAGRMLHDEKGRQQLIPYGNKPHEVIYSVSRGGLNTLLMDAAEATGRVSIRFGETCCGVAFDRRTVRVRTGADRTIHDFPYAVLIGTDGSASAVRAAIMERTDGNLGEEPLGHGYKELSIPGAPGGGFRMETNALHIWPASR